ncbi:helix-turn-helix domain-containing protein [Streptomyces sp. NEAU-Y11]|uniref:helix-turn-helix domain-containing protein n=1 Tax=Streptomyces cucumeris TaxID=2962890 RepID=UPI0020C87F43|nr:helix-turn-helix domain-containing protein [Streptomyces sp. NEAU-Y11]MCP9209315.1 helix-turn-helix domain-containing protein [Streptomyces sp. NEAU-Y11]
MTKDDKQRPLAVTLGERLRQFREDRGLRQADVASAAAAWGLKWGRSSIASLEAGTRNLSVEELLLLPFVVSELGGWDQPLLPPEAAIPLSKTRFIPASQIASCASRLTISTLPNTNPFDGMVAGVRVSGEDEASDSLTSARMHAEALAWDLFLSRTYPSFRYRDAEDGAMQDPELVAKIAKRIKLPAEVAPSWGLVSVLSLGLWGRSIADERDHRASARGEFEGRALQSVKGHVTRELVGELEAEAHRVWPEIERAFSPVRAIWDHQDLLTEWDRRARGEAARTRFEVKRRDAIEAFDENVDAVAAASFIGEQLREARIRASLSVEEVAEMMRVHDASLVAAIERGDYFKHSFPRAAQEYIKAFARIVGISPEELLTKYEVVRVERRRHGYS